MALQKNKIPIPFIGGLDQKTDDKQIQPGKLSRLENAEFNKLGKLSKRNGAHVLKSDIIGTTSKIQSAKAISKFKDELNLFSGTKLYNYLDANEKWSERGDLVSVRFASRSVVKNSYDQRTPDVATNGQLIVSVWSDSRGGSRYSVFDETSNSVVVSDVELSDTGKLPRAFKIGNIFVLMYYKHANTSLYYRTIKAETAALISAETQIVSDVDTNMAWYDATSRENRVYFCYKSTSGGDGISLRFLNQNGVVSAEIKKTETDAALSTVVLTDDNVSVVYMNDNSGTEELKAFTYDIDMGIELMAPTLITNATCDLANCRPVASDAGNNKVNVYYEHFTTVFSLDVCNVYFAQFDQSGMTIAETMFKRNHMLVTKPFKYLDSVYLFLGHFFDDNIIQPTYLLYTDSGILVSKAYASLAMEKYDLVSNVHERSCSQIVETASGKFKVALLKKSQLVTDSGSIKFNFGVNTISFDFSAETNFNSIEMSSNLHVVGGYLSMYDGAEVSEHGFNVFPDKFSYTLTGASGLDDATYSYQVVYAWIDNQGQIHRSAPSIAQDVTVSGGPKSVTLNIPSLIASKKSNVFIEVYRTQGTSSGTTYYKVTSTTAPSYNNPNANVTTIIDSVNDNDLLSREILYTTGGVLDNIGAPACSLIKDFKGRLFVDNLDDEAVINYSKITSEGSPIEFNDGLYLPIGSKDGRATALSSLDDKLIIFKRNSVYVVTGDGPNNIGEQNNFTLPQLISSDVGCVNSKSVVEVPMGVMFESVKGIYLLDRNLQLSFVGKDVEDFNDLTITSAVLVPNKNQVRFITSDGPCLVYNYLVQQWGTFTNMQAVGALNYEDTFVYVKADGRVFQENDEYKDDASSIVLKATTGWLSFANIQGFQRIYKFLILGNFKNSHKLKVKIAYNFNSTFIHEATIDASTLAGTSYGEQSPYGEGIFGGEFPLYQWEIRPKLQKCQSIMISIEDYQDENFGEGLELSHIMFEVGAKQSTSTTATTSKAT